MTRDVNFSLKAYQEARRRLRELSSSGEARKPAACGDENDANAANNCHQVSSSTTQSKEGRDKEGMPPQSSASSSSSSLLDAPEEDFEKRFGEEALAITEAMLKAVKTAGLRPARESALVTLTGKLQRHTKAWTDALEDRVDKVCGDTINYTVISIFNGHATHGMWP